jgi:hypothetical protein
MNDLLPHEILIPHPYKGLTFRKGQREINVHSVDSDTVYYGKYEDGQDWPAYLFRMSVEDFVLSSGRAILDGATVYSRIT